MFEDSLVESSGRLAARHPWTTLVSFVCQIIALSALLLLSLLYTESLPVQHWINVLQAPPPPPAGAPPQRAMTNSAKVETSENILTVPSEVPIHAEAIHDLSPAAPPSGIGIAGDFPGGIPNGMPVSVLDVLKPPPPAPPVKAVVQKLRVSSGVSEGMLIHQVRPQYPAPARLARVEGRVALQAAIGKDGAVQNLQVISGHPLLVGAAIEAVKQWRYKPYYLNGEAVEVETQIVVNFVLSQN
jgi:periplasmic protein TonB